MQPLAIQDAQQVKESQYYTLSVISCSLTGTIRLLRQTPFCSLNGIEYCMNV
jgi:hypothetical protein